LEKNTEDIDSESEHQEVPSEDTAGETVGTQEVRSEGQRPAVVCRNQRKSCKTRYFAREAPELSMAE
jgi:hypothetical protein